MGIRTWLTGLGRRRQGGPACPAPAMETLEERLLLAVTVGNEHVSILINDEGSFTIWRTSDEADLLYPGASTTEFSVKVNENVYWTNAWWDFASIEGPYEEPGGAYIQYTTVEGVVVRHTFTLDGEAVGFTATATNASALSHQVQVRYLLDTKVGMNDGSPLYAEGVTDSQGSNICTYEVDIPQVDFYEWRGYDQWPNPTLESVGTIGTIPDRMVFAYWPTSQGYAWDYAPNPSQRFDSDSSVLIYFDLGLLTPGGQNESVTYYGLGPPLAVGDLAQVGSELLRLSSAASQAVDAAFYQFASDFGDVMAAVRSGGADAVASAVHLGAAVDLVWSGQIDPSTSWVPDELSARAGISLDAAVMVLDHAAMYGAGTTGVGLAGVGLDHGSLAAELTAWFDAPNTNTQDTDDDGDTDNMDFVLDVGNSATAIANLLYEDLSLELGLFRSADGTSLAQPGLGGLAAIMAQAVNGYLADIQDASAEDYPIGAMVGYLRSLRGQVTESHTRQTVLPPIDDVVTRRLYAVGSYHNQSALIADRVGAYSAGGRAWLSTAYGSIGPVDAGPVSAVSMVSCGGWTAAGQIVVDAGPTADVPAGGHYDVLAEEALQHLLHQGFFGTVLEAISMADVIVGSVGYFRTQEAAGWTAAGMDNTGVSMIDSSFRMYSTVLDAGEAAGGVDGHVEVQNAGSYSAAVRAYVNIYLAPTVSGDTDLAPWTFAASAGQEMAIGQQQIDIEPITVAAMSLLGVEQYYAFVYLSVGPALIARHVGTQFDSFRVDSDEVLAQLPSATNAAWHNQVDQGESWETSPPHIVFGSALGSYFTLEYYGSDLDLHVRDALNRHVGVNYSTGEIENQILGATYSGPFGRVERIYIPSTAFGVYTVEVVALNTEGAEGFAVVVTDLMPHGPVVSVAPAAVWRIFNEPTDFDVSLTVRETGGQQDYVGLEAASSDLVSGALTIPAADVQFDVPSMFVQAGSSVIITATVEVPADAPPGTYSGTFDIGTGPLLTVPVEFVILGYTPEITVLLGATELVDGQAEVIDYGATDQASPPPSRSFIVRNDGDRRLTLGDVTVPDGYVVTDPLAAYVFPGQSDTFVVELDNTTPGQKSGQISFLSDDADESPFNFPVTGFVWAAVLFEGRLWAQFTDADGELVTIFLTGPGSGSVRFASGAGNEDASAIILRGTTRTSALHILTEPGGWTTVGDVDVDGSLRSITARTTTLTGDVSITGSLGRMHLGAVADQHVITIGPGVGAWDATTLLFGNVTDLTVRSQMPIRSITANSWHDTDATPDVIEAPWLGSLIVNGDFQAGLTLTTVGGLWPTLGSVRIAGGLSDAAWDVNGRVGLVNVTGSVSNWRLFSSAGQLSSVQSLLLGPVQTAEVSVDGSLGMVRCWQWLGGQIHADVLQALLVFGNRANSVVGNFGADLTLDGLAYASPWRLTLGLARIAGNIVAGTWNIVGNSGSVLVGGGAEDWSPTFTSNLRYLALGGVASANLSVGGRLGLLRTSQWLGGRIHARQMGTMLIAGRRTGGIQGDFGADVQLDGVAGARAWQRSLGYARIAGSITGGTWTVGGNAGFISAGATASGWNATFTGKVLGLRTAGAASGAIQAASVGFMYVGGDFRNGQLTVTSAADAARPWVSSINLMIVNGWMVHAALRAAGNVGTVIAGGMAHSSVFAGVKDTVKALPVSPDDFRGGAAGIRQVLLRGVARDVDRFVNSNVAAWRIGTASLSRPGADNGGVPFGVAGHTIRRVSYRDGEGLHNWSGLGQQASSSAFGDGVIRLV